MPITPEVLDHTSKWMVAFREQWHEETPLKLHSREFDGAGNPQWHPEFAAWLQGVGKNSERRARLTSAMRHLRKKSIREYEVAYRMIVLGEPIERTTAWLNERAIRNGVKDRYEIADTQVIIVSAVDKLISWW
jgi:hypothetical protein